ncbi:MAG TPA: hypothetical protein DDY37_03665 [Legionella sp.]|nr:hypothetical protein [Legionella sp.]
MMYLCYNAIYLAWFFYMKNDEENICASINPCIVRWYLMKELKELNCLKQRAVREEESFSRIKHPLDAETIADVYYFDTIRKQITRPLIVKLNTYKTFFNSDKPLSCDEVIDYFEEQLAALNAKETIERIVVDLAYAAHEHAEKNSSIKAGTMGERLFQTVPKGSEVVNHVRFSDELTSEKTLITSEHSVVESTLRVEAAIFTPLSLRNTNTDLIDVVEQQFFTPNAILGEPCENLTFENLTLLETQLCADDAGEKSKLYRFWQKPMTVSPASNEINPASSFKRVDRYK